MVPFIYLTLQNDRVIPIIGFSKNEQYLENIESINIQLSDNVKSRIINEEQDNQYISTNSKEEIRSQFILHDYYRNKLFSKWYKLTIPSKALNFACFFILIIPLSLRPKLQYEWNWKNSVRK